MLAGEIQLEDIDLEGHKKTAVADVISPEGQKRPSQAQIQKMMQEKEAG